MVDEVPCRDGLRRETTASCIAARSNWYMVEDFPGCKLLITYRQQWFLCFLISIVFLYAVAAERAYIYFSFLSSKTIATMQVLSLEA